MSGKPGQTHIEQSGTTAMQPGLPAVKEEDNKELLQAYSLIADAYHRIDDFRAKLLALLPLAAGTTGILLLLRTDLGLRNEGKAQILVAVGIYGFLTTLGLCVYEIRGIQRCQDLIKAGRQLEGKLELPLVEAKGRRFRLGMFDAASDAYLRDFRVVVPSDGVASLDRYEPERGGDGRKGEQDPGKTPVSARCGTADARDQQEGMLVIRVALWLLGALLLAAAGCGSSRTARAP